MRAGNKYPERSAHNIGRVTGRPVQDCFTRIGEAFAILRLTRGGKVHTITKAWPAFLLPFNEALMPPKRGKTVLFHDPGREPFSQADEFVGWIRLQMLTKPGE